eukprot:1195652-Prorocentrum_minimum.AAC.3
MRGVRLSRADPLLHTTSEKSDARLRLVPDLKSFSSFNKIGHEAEARVAFFAASLVQQLVGTRETRASH